jgi:hypothetical protein
MTSLVAERSANRMRRATSYLPINLNAQTYATNATQTRLARFEIDVASQL